MLDSLLLLLWLLPFKRGAVGVFFLLAVPAPRLGMAMGAEMVLAEPVPTRGFRTDDDSALVLVLAMPVTVWRGMADAPRTLLLLTLRNTVLPPAGLVPEAAAVDGVRMELAELRRSLITCDNDGRVAGLTPS